MLPTFSSNQYTALTRKRYPGLNYEDLAQARGLNLPAQYASTDATNAQQKTYDLYSDYYKNQESVDREKLNIAYGEAEYNKEKAEAEHADAEARNKAQADADLKSTILGGVQLGVSGFNIYKQSNSADKLTDALDKISNPGQPGGNPTNMDPIQNIITENRPTEEIYNISKGISNTETTTPVTSTPEGAPSGPGLSEEGVQQTLQSGPPKTNPSESLDISGESLEQGGKDLENLGTDQFADAVGSGDTSVSGVTDVGVNIGEDLTEEAAAGTVGSSTLGQVVGAVAPVLSYIAAAEEVKGMYGGGQKQPWEDKSGSQKATSAPATSGMFPGLALYNQNAPNSTQNTATKTYAALGKAENIVLAPIDYIFGNQDFKNANQVGDSWEAIKAAAGAPYEDFKRDPEQFAKDEGAKATTVALAGIDPVASVISNIFCFVAGTKIKMATGQDKNVEDLDLMDDLLLGGSVIGIGKVLSTDIYDYKGTRVQGEHAVFENGKWLRVRDSQLAVLITDDGPTAVYPVMNTNHLVVVGSTIFADFVEVDRAYDFTEQERIIMLNNNTSRNRILQEFVDANS